MPQAGIHGLVGLAMGKLALKREWLLLGIVLGSMLPDMDALVIALATLTGANTHGLHRTWSHSILIMAVLVAAFQIAAVVKRTPRIGNLGIGLGLGMLLHVLVDLALWFRGVQLGWPFYPALNFWQGYSPPAWWHNKLEFALEFGMIALFFYVLGRFATKLGTDSDYLPKLRMWTLVETGLCVVFTVLVFSWTGYLIFFGAVYIFSLGLALVVTVRMRATIGAMV